ncbi:MAG TPA: hypothetical protein VME44_16535 [Streptosporangiaceae bacterium]|nr:hypothetical protein [Streptosporangiaceae bacterium]
MSGLAEADEIVTAAIQVRIDGNGAATNAVACTPVRRLSCARTCRRAGNSGQAGQLAVVTRQKSTARRLVRAITGPSMQVRLLVWAGT